MNDQHRLIYLLFGATLALVASRAHAAVPVCAVPALGGACEVLGRCHAPVPTVQFGSFKIPATISCQRS